MRRPSRIACYMLLSLSFVALAPANLNADCACGGGELEIVFILDCSGSMNHTLGTLQEQIKRFVEALEGQVQRLRAAVIVYRTREYSGKQEKLAVFDFSRDGKELAGFLRGQTAEGGGEEIVGQALEAALTRLSWTKGTRKVAVVLGDEQPKEEDQKRCLEWAREMKEKGIVLNTVTASQTAWIYWAPANEGTWKQQLAGMGDEAKRVFKLPHFTELAEATGGISVSSWNSKELVLWLLAFGLGMKEQEAKEKIDVDEYLEWAKQRDIEETSRAAAREKAAGVAQEAPLIGWLAHSGEWKVPHRFDGLFEHLGERLALAGSPSVELLQAGDARLERFPILYLTGHGAIKWSRTEKEALKGHLERGAVLIADACCGDAAFGESLREILKGMFPERALEQLPREHPLFACGHRLNLVRRSERSRTAPLQDTPPELWALSLPEASAAASGKARLAVIYSPHDLGCAWRARPLGVPCQHRDEDGVRLSANIFLWALTR